LVAEYPADPIEKFEDVWLPFVERAAEAVAREIGAPSKAPPAEQKKILEAALDAEGARGQALRAWLTKGTLDDDPEAVEDMLEAAKRTLKALDGDAATNHPLVRTPEPEPSKLDPSVAVPHFGAGPLFLYAYQGGTLTKRENEHIDWCQPCRQRCLGALLVLRRFRTLLGGALPNLPEISPEFDQNLQSESPGVPKIDADRRNRKGERDGGAKRTWIAVVAVVAVLALSAAAVALLTR
jgi:hypothetical protein